MIEWIYLAFSILIGLAVGSFLNVLILRIPKGKSVAFPPSHCPKCKKRLEWWHNIPLLSYILLGGKCYFCKAKISIQYPLVELATSLIYALTFLKSGDFVQTLIVSSVFALLLALSLIDFKYKAVPDSLNLMALTISIFSGHVITSFTEALLFAGGFTLLRFYVSYFAKKEALGEADIMIAATMGAILGVKLGLFAIFLSAIIALPIFLIAGKKDMQLPYIPFLALALYLTYMFDSLATNLISWLYG